MGEIRLEGIRRRQVRGRARGRGASGGGEGRLAARAFFAVRLARAEEVVEVVLWFGGSSGRGGALRKEAVGAAPGAEHRGSSGSSHEAALERRYSGAFVGRCRWNGCGSTEGGSREGRQVGRRRRRRGNERRGLSEGSTDYAAELVQQRACNVSGAVREPVRRHLAAKADRNEPNDRSRSKSADIETGALGRLQHAHWSHPCPPGTRASLPNRRDEQWRPLRGDARSRSTRRRLRARPRLRRRSDGTACAPTPASRDRARSCKIGHYTS